MKSSLRFAAISAIALATTGAADAEIVVDDEVVNIVVESRFQKPAAQATATERNTVIDELTNIYVISNLPRAAELAREPRVSANIELQRRALMFQAFLNDFMASNAATDQEIFNLYEEQYGQDLPAEYKARHILVETQSQAMELIEALNGGADFATLAREKSTGPSGPNGGDLGWFLPQDMVPPFSQAVSALEDGQYTREPVQTQFGWHVILKEGTRESTPPPLDSIRDSLKQRVEQQKFEAFLEKARADAES